MPFLWGVTFFESLHETSMHSPRSPRRPVWPTLRPIHAFPRPPAYPPSRTPRHRLQGLIRQVGREMLPDIETMSPPGSNSTSAASVPPGLTNDASVSSSLASIMNEINNDLPVSTKDDVIERITAATNLIGNRMRADTVDRVQTLLSEALDILRTL